MDPDKFARIAESLRQYRRAELKDFQDELGSKPIDSLYVDPLQNNAVLKSVLSSNTTYILGRKGTGKSTVFARAQNALREDKSVISCYIDVKSLQDVASTSTNVIDTTNHSEIDQGIISAHLIRKSFLAKVLADLLKEVDGICDEMSIMDIWRGKKKTLEEFKSKLSSLEKRIRKTTLNDHELPVLRNITQKWQKQRTDEHTNGRSLKGSGKLGLNEVSAGGEATLSEFDKSLDDNVLYNEYSEIVLRSFPFDEIIEELQSLLGETKLKRIVVFFDDFSELKLVDQKLFVDVVLAPLNNSSNEAVKLKVAGYSGRVYYGRIDSTKVDTINLDFSALYEAQDVQSMEHAATDYTERLLRKRFSAFDENIEDYFEKGSSASLEDYMRLIFQTTFNVPRLMGALLHTCYLDSISSQRRITQASIRLAARKYYEGTISQYFERMNRFALEPFENKLDRHNQQKLLSCVVEHARSVKRKIDDGTVGGKYFLDVSNPPTSHFVVSSSLADVFNSLESNFLLSKYKDTRDKNGKPVVVYALYYGLTESDRMGWGYPTGREYRNYFVQRCFDYTSEIHNFLAGSQTIRCASCATSFPLEKKESFELFQWKCPECGKGQCSIVNLADDFEAEVATVKQDLMLEEVELNILSTLYLEEKEMAAGEISSLIDVSYQLVGHRTSKLRDLGLLDKERSDSDNRMRSSLTGKASITYFN